MKELLHKRIFWIISSCVIAFIVISVTVIMLLFKNFTYPDTGVTYYGLSDSISLENYIPAQRAKELVDAGCGIAFNVGSRVYYKSGDFAEADGDVLLKENNVPQINCDALKKIIPSLGLSGTVSVADAAKAIDKNYVIHENKLVVFTDKPYEIGRV